MEPCSTHGPSGPNPQQAQRDGHKTHPRTPLRSTSMSYLLACTKLWSACRAQYSRSVPRPDVFDLHRALQPYLGKARAVSRGGILRTAIRVMNIALRSFPIPQHSCSFAQKAV